MIFNWKMYYLSLLDDSEAGQDGGCGDVYVYYLGLPDDSEAGQDGG